MEMDTAKRNILIIDRSGYSFFLDKGGTSIIAPEEYNVFFMTKPVHLQSIRLQDVAGVLVADTENAQVVMELAQTLHAVFPLHRIIAMGERHLEVAAELRGRLGISGMSSEETIPFRDKLPMKEKVRAAGIPVPDFMPISSPLDAAELLVRHGRIVVKPRCGMGSCDTYVVGTAGELQELAAVTSRFGPMEAEEFIAGEMYHVDGIVHKGQVLLASPFRYLTTTLDYESLDAICVISETNPTISRRLLELHAKVVQGLSLQDGTTHLECFRTPDDELVFCEIAARSGGGSTIEAFAALHEVDLRRTAIELHLGRGYGSHATAGAACVGLVDFFPRPGHVTAISTPDDFPEEWIYFKRIKPKPGDDLRAPVMSGDAAALFVVTGSDEVETLERMRLVRERFVLAVAAEAAAS